MYYSIRASVRARYLYAKVLLHVPNLLSIRPVPFFTHLFYQPLRKFCILLGKGKIIILVLLVYRHIFSKDTLHLLPNLVL